MAGAKYKLEFVMSGLPKMSNQLFAGSWKIRAGNANIWKRKVWKSCWHLAPKVPLGQARITLVRFSTRRPDSDGLVSGFKPIIDGLVEAKIIIGDSFDIIGFPKYEWEKTRVGHGKVSVKVEEV